MTADSKELQKAGMFERGLECHPCSTRTKRREGKEHVVPSLGKVPLGLAQASALDHELRLNGG